MTDKEGLPWWLRWSRICLQHSRPGFNHWAGKILWRKEWQPTPVFCPGKLLWTEEPGGGGGPTIHGVTKSWTRLSSQHTHMDKDVVYV